MMVRIAIALIALAAPVFAQRGGAHAGSLGSRGSAGHVGFSGPSGFSQARSFVSPAPFGRSGPSGSARLRAAVPLNYSSFKIPFNGNRFIASRSRYNPAGAGRSRTWNRGQFDARRRSFENWYLYTYPTWPGYGYPFVIDPGFYDWGDSETSANDESGAAPVYSAPYPDEGYGVPDQQAAPPAPAAVSASLPEQPLTVIFKSGRAPLRMQNYMMTTKALTDLDAQHYERIPLDQIDEVATQRVNSAAAVDFEVPGTTPN